MRSTWLALFGVLFFSLSCTRGDANYSSSGDVVIRLTEFPETRSPLNYTSKEAEAILAKVYDFPEEQDDNSNAVFPRLCELISNRDSAEYVIFTFKINPNAKWSNGEKITTDDVLTTFKVFNLPGIDNLRLRLNYSFISGLRVQDSNEGVFELMAKGNFLSLRPRIGLFYVLPEFLYDPEWLLRELSIKEILEKGDALENDPRVTAYRDYLLSINFSENIKAGGSGPYKITLWDEGRRIELEKDNSWWGIDASETWDYLLFYPDRIIYEVIPEESIALIALKNGTVDVVAGVSPSQFRSIEQDGQYEDQFHFLTPLSYQFGYLALNSRDPKLNLNVRRALSHLIPYELIIETALLGFGSRTVGPINPADSMYYNSDLGLVGYNEDSAIHYLNKEGYTFQDGQWFDGDKRKVEFDLAYPTGQPVFETSALIIQDKLKSFGIEVQLISKERSVLIQESRAHNFQLSISSFRGGPLAHNFTPLFSTQAANIGGLNFSGFGDQQSDNVINRINISREKTEKIMAMKQLQELLNAQRTMIFLFFEQERILVSKKFDNVYGFSRKPGYNATKFKLVNPN